MTAVNFLTDKNAELMEKSAQFISPTNARAFDIVAAKAQGTYLWDVNGTKYLDFTTGIAVNNIGHCHPKVVEATKNQIDKLIHCSAVTSHKGIIALAEKLAEVTPGDLNCVFLNNSGGEAIDAAIKFARFVTGRPNIIHFTGSFHGRTLLATALTSSKTHYREGYEPLPSGIFAVPYPHCFRCPAKQTAGSCQLECFDFIETSLKHLVKPHSVAAIIMEPVLGEGGYVVPASSYNKPGGYMQRLRELCDKHGIMLILDEVQTGFGRTGKWFAANHWNLVPDAMVLAKGIASGFPMAAVVSRRELMAKWTAGRHGSTYGGNPVACAAALASMEVIESEDLISNAQIMGVRMVAKLKELARKFPCIGDIRGLGLMIGVELVDENGAPDGDKLSKLVDECFKRRLLLLDCGTDDHVIRFLPPLNVTSSEVDEALRIVEEALTAIN